MTARSRGVTLVEVSGRFGDVQAVDVVTLPGSDRVQALIASSGEVTVVLPAEALRVLVDTPV